MADPKEKETEVEETRDAPPDEVEHDEVEGDGDEGGEESADAAELAGEGEPDDGEAEVDEEPPRRSRGENRFQTLANEARAAQEKADRVEREFSEFKAAQRNYQPQESPEQEAQRLALMTPDEAMNYKLDKATKGFEQKLQQIQLNNWETNDSTRFNALCASDAVAKKYAGRVETTRREMMQQNGGMPIAREAILDVLIGRDVRAKRGPGVEQERKKGQENIRRAQSRPGSSKGDVSPERRRKGSTAADRLDGVEI